MYNVQDSGSENCWTSLLGSFIHPFTEISTGGW